MRIEIVGKQIDVGDALREHISSRLNEIAEKFAHRPVESAARISRDAGQFKCDYSMHLGTGLVAQSSATANTPYGACDQALTRLEKQLRRYKGRLKDHHQRRKEPIAQIDAMAYVLTGDLEIDHAQISPEDRSRDEGVSEELKDPAIIAETKATISSFTVGEAVMQMELKGDNFLLFLNEANDRLNAVYRRLDGNIGWIDPQVGSTYSGKA